MNNIICQLCKKEFKNYNSLAKHLYHTHKYISKEEYYKKFINKVNSICICGKKKKFRDLGIGYMKHCSPKCRSNNTKNPCYWKGKKQSDEIIRKRVDNTDQIESHKKRKNTMIKKYGVENYGQTAEWKKIVPEKLKGRKNKKRTKEWSEKIIISKRKNGTLKHTKQAKINIGEGLRKTYRDPNFDKSKILSKQTSGICGTYNNIFFRSSLELAYLVWCFKNKKQVIGASTKKFAVKVSDIQSHYPDFYNITDDVIVEIKPYSMIRLSSLKICAAKEKYKNKYRVVTETENSYLSKTEIENLIKDGYVILTKKSQEKLERYKH